MLEPPELPDDRIIAAVRRHYDLAVTELTFLPLGQDVRAWTYRVVTVDAAYFLKLRRGNPNEVGLRVPRYLVDRGVRHIVAPVPTRGGALWGTVEGFTLTLFPLIAGHTGMVQGMDEAHWVTFGAALRAVHGTPITPELDGVVPRESFSSALVEAVKAVEAHIDSQPLSDSIERDLAAFWQRNRVEINALIERFEALGRLLRANTPPFVLCHTDVHTNNVLIDTGGRLWIVDWDDALLAPKESDLMMGIGGLGSYPAGPRETSWFLRGYGTGNVDQTALAYYRHVRALGDIGAYGEQVMLLPGAGEVTKRNAIRRFMSLFTPGSIVTLAGEWERSAT